MPGEHLLKTLSVMWDLMSQRGVDRRFGRKLLPLLESRGMKGVEGEGHVVFYRGATAGGRLIRANFEQMHEDIVTSGGVTEDEFQQDLARLDDPAVVWPSPVLWTVRARKP